MINAALYSGVGRLPAGLVMSWGRHIRLCDPLSIERLMASSVAPRGAMIREYTRSVGKWGESFDSKSYKVLVSLRIAATLLSRLVNVNVQPVLPC